MIMFWNNKTREKLNYRVFEMSHLDLESERIIWSPKTDTWWWYKTIPDGRGLWELFQDKFPDWEIIIKF
jgi:hypothetical protein